MQNSHFDPFHARLRFHWVFWRFSLQHSKDISFADGKTQFNYETAEKFIRIYKITSFRKIIFRIFIASVKKLNRNASSSTYKYVLISTYKSSAGNTKKKWSYIFNYPSALVILIIISIASNHFETRSKPHTRHSTILS